MSDLTKTLIQLWQAACIDKPLRDSCRVENGDFVLTVTGNQDNWQTLVKASGVPSTATQEINGDTLTVRWASHADRIFSADGLLSEHLDNYEPRRAQLHMGRMVQRAIEMRQTAVIEAGTGTGKSFAYAAICLAMGLRCVISTSNKALQMQLYRKDIPFLTNTIYPGKRVELVQGKGNYACRNKVEDYQVPGVYAIDNPQLREWYTTTKTGNTEEIPFAVDWKDLANITADSNCLGKMCNFYADCHYYQSKALRGDADVLITNHMLLAMHQLYPGAGILPDVDVIVVDEAHNFAGYVRNATGVEFQTDRIEKLIAEAREYEVITDSADTYTTGFRRELNRMIDDSRDRQIGIPTDKEIMPGLFLSGALTDIADEIWHPADMPSTPGEISIQRFADRLRTMADNVQQMSEPTKPGFVRYIDNSGDAVTLNNTPYDVSEFVGRLAGFRTHSAEQPDHTRCTRCNRELTAATVALLDGKPYGPDCIRHADPYGDAVRVNLSDWLDYRGEYIREKKYFCKNCNSPAYFDGDNTEEWQCTKNCNGFCGVRYKESFTGVKPESKNSTSADEFRNPVIFTSATLAAPDFDAFLRDSGIPYALQMQAESPFDYAKNALLYVPNGTSPKPNQDDWRDWMIAEIRRLVACAQGGAFLLFTSYANMQAARDALRRTFERDGYTVLVQGELPKLEIGKRFAEDGNAVLFATKSFFEGVSIDGNALRLVVIDKLPFEAPNPLNQAQEAALQDYARDVLGLRGSRAEWYPFNAFRVPRMIIEVKQGVGRLIRTATDTGVMAILDSRTRSAKYGREMVLPSLPPAQLVGDLYTVGNWYQARRRAAMPKPQPKPQPMPIKTILSNGDFTEDDDGMLWA